MLIDGKYYQSIWLDENDKGKIMVIDQEKLPFFFETKEVCSVEGEHGLKEIVVEERDQDEITSVSGYADGEIKSVRICPDDTKAGNWGFDITPARLVTGLITEKGVCRADEKSIKKIFSDKFK